MYGTMMAHEKGCGSRIENVRGLSPGTHVIQLSHNNVLDICHKY